MTGLIVAGMHRSGTSLMARTLAAGGWHPGEVTLASDREEYTEDATFVALHRAWLDICLPPGEGHRDWGISDGGVVHLDSLSPSTRAELVDGARSFAARRDGERERWVAKDPRASLFLPLWAEVESLRFVLVYRSPWDVVDSAVRLGAEEFCRAPRRVLDAWLDHNRRLADFATEHRDRCMVVASTALVNDPGSVWGTLGRWAALNGDPPPGLIDPARWVECAGDHPLAALHREVYPDHARVLDRLDALADVPPPSGHRRHDRHVPSRRTSPGGTLAPGTGVQVVIPCRDDGDFVVTAVASAELCAASSGTGMEVTLVDDGSTETETLRVLEVMRRLGYQVITTAGVGLAAARNAALELSSTAAVIPLDADNRLLPALTAEVGSIERGEADIVHGPWRRFGMQTGVVEPPDLTLEALVPGNAIDACALIARPLLERLGGWDPALDFWEDWDLWLGSLSLGARVHRLDEVTFDYLVRPGALNSRARTDPAARGAVVEHVVTKHADLLGPLVARLVLQVHRTDGALGAAESARAEAEAGHRALEAAYRSLEVEYRSLQAAYRAALGSS